MKKKIFGKELRKYRREAGLTLAKLADSIGCSVVFMSDVERGKKNPPSPEKIRTLLEVIGKEEKAEEMIELAFRSRRSIEISVDDKDADMAEMLVALARRCDEGMDPESVSQIKQILREST